MLSSTRNRVIQLASCSMPRISSPQRALGKTVDSSSILNISDQELRSVKNFPNGGLKLLVSAIHTKRFSLIRSKNSKCRGGWLNASVLTTFLTKEMLIPERRLSE